ncbi:restriction endonuclease subunit S [Rhizobium leguminosarum]|uniref:restriction endonuclease subunit S n=1 Tax=Rhizobium leguminosarum TaxID=384 RepID=UPI001C97E376|nr:restriction endonuclease subunit S [Rhizobium leguminosarum]MBY5424838.1 restriction endonuclease subunit S [Rhizobium leguminosarum]
MSSDRVRTTLGEILTFKRGYDLPTSDRRNGEYSVVSSSGVSGSHDQPRAKAPGVVTGRYGTVGELFYIKNDFWPLNTSLYVVDFKGNIPRYIYYFLHSVEFGEFSDKSSVPGVNRNHLHNLEISFERDPNVQSSVAKILGDLDDKIELLQATNRTLSDIAQALFKAWFIDFLPVRAKAAGASGFQGMPQSLFDALSDVFEPSEVGEIPKGWHVEALDNLVAVPITRGLTPKYIEVGGVAVLSQKCVRNGEINLQSSRRHDDMVKPIRDKVIERYDILVNSTGTGTLGRVAQICDLPNAATFDSHLTLVRPDKTKMMPLVLGYDLMQREREIESLAHGSTGQTELSRQKLGRLKVIVPPMDDQIAFGEFLLPLVELKNRNKSEIETLTSLRDTLLPPLISGRLKAPPLALLGMKELRDGG